MGAVDLHTRNRPTLAFRKHRRWWMYWEDANGTVPDPIVRFTMNSETRTTMGGDRRIAYIDYIPAPVPPDHPHAQKVRVTADSVDTRTTMAGDRRLTNGRRIG